MREIFLELSHNTWNNVLYNPWARESENLGNAPLCFMETLHQDMFSNQNDVLRHRVHASEGSVTCSHNARHYHPWSHVTFMIESVRSEDFHVPVRKDKQVRCACWIRATATHTFLDHVNY